MRNKPIETVFHFFCSLKLAVVLLFLMVADLCFGYLCLQGHATLFQPLNEVGLKQWLITYARSEPFFSAWFILLLPLLSGLAVNTLCCTGNKLYHLFTSHIKRWSSHSFLHTLSIHLIHLAIVTLLLGYLASYTLSTIHPSITLTPGVLATIPGSNINVELIEMQMIPYTGKHLASFNGRNINTNAQLKLSDKNMSKTTTLSINHPAYFRGFSFFLQRFNPTSSRAMSSSHYIVVDIRRDPGVIPTFTGIVAFLIGLAGYLFFRYSTRKNRNLSL